MRKARNSTVRAARATERDESRIPRPDHHSRHTCEREESHNSYLQ